MPKPPKTKPAVTTGGGTWTKKKQKEYDDYWKEQERIREQEYEKERKRMEAEMKKAAEEAKKNREAAVRKVKDECKPCDPIRAEIAAKEKEIEAKSDEIAQKESALQEAKDKVKDAEEKAKDAQAKKDAYNGPGDYVEDPKTGKRVTSQDLAINKMVAQNSWQEYVNGDITAQELEEKWKNFDEEELAKAKKDYEESLDKAITDAEAGVEAAKKAVSDADLAVQHAEGDKTLLEDDLAELYKKLDDCLRLCEKYASWIAEETWGTEKAIGYDDLVSKEKPKTTPKPVTVTKPKAAVTTPKTEPTGPCKTGEFLNDARCSNSCKPNEKCEWYRTVEEGTCTGCTATCEAGEYYNSQSKCEDDCDGDCTRRFRTDCWVCGEAAAATEGPKNCDEYCATFGDYTGVKPDWKSYIMSEIADVTCKSRVNLVFPGGIEVGECKCYTNSKPSISFGPDIVCQDTSCGDVACGSSAQCSCGTNCIQIVNCNWGGWKWEGDANTGGPVPQLAVQNQ
ncbi:TPA: hypothetical protein HA265_03945 [Candidatus Woesearchaeota archaeon]|nr:hypothetical protein [Candidatus Woesearchaeota archaeon]